MAHESPAPATPSPAAAPFGAAIADPGPLGLAAFAATTFFLSTVNAGLLPKTVEAGVLGLAFFYGGLAQLLAGMWEFVKGNTFGALAFASFGAFWLSFWYLVDHVLPALTEAKTAETDVSHAVATYLLAWTIFTAYMTVASLRTTGAILLVFLALTLTFLMLTIGNFNGSTGTVKVGGYLGLVTAALAWYGSFAGVANATFKKTILPVFPLSR